MLYSEIKLLTFLKECVNDKEKALKIIERFKMLHGFLKNKILPKPEARMQANILWMCKYCEYKDRCYKDSPRI